MVTERQLTITVTNGNKLIAICRDGGIHLMAVGASPAAVPVNIISCPLAPSDTRSLLEMLLLSEADGEIAT